MCCTEDLRRVEPSSDFPTADDVPPCPEPPRGLIIALVLAGALLAAAVGYVAACARARARARPGDDN